MTEQVKPDAAVRDALEHARTLTQQLHQTISGTLAKRTGATKTDIEGAIKKAKEAAESTRSAMRARHEAAQETTKKHLTEAVARLEASERHAADSLKSHGEVLHTALGKALADARASAQNISEAIAAQRSAHAAKQPTKKAS